MRGHLQDGGTHLGVLRVVLVLNAIDLLQKVAHTIHLQPRGEGVRSRHTAPPAAAAPAPPPPPRQPSLPQHLWFLFASTALKLPVIPKLPGRQEQGRGRLLPKSPSPPSPLRGVQGSSCHLLGDTWTLTTCFCLRGFTQKVPSLC